MGSEKYNVSRLYDMSTLQLRKRGRSVSGKYPRIVSALSDDTGTTKLPAGDVSFTKALDAVKKVVVGDFVRARKLFSSIKPESKNKIWITTEFTVVSSLQVDPDIVNASVPAPADFWDCRDTAFSTTVLIAMIFDMPIDSTLEVILRSKYLIFGDVTSGTKILARIGISQVADALPR